jgi:hypothetical protein
VSKALLVGDTRRIVGDEPDERRASERGEDVDDGRKGRGIEKGSDSGCNAYDLDTAFEGEREIDTVDDENK